MQDYNQIHEVTSDVIGNVLENYMDHLEKSGTEIPQEYLELFLSKSKEGTWTAIDNVDGHAWTEDFKNECIARRWLIGELATDEAYELDEKRKYIATCTKAGEFDNFAPGVAEVTHYDIFLEDGKLYVEDHPSGNVHRYFYNPPANHSEQQIVSDVLARCRLDKRWKLQAWL